MESATRQRRSLAPQWPCSTVSIIGANEVLLAVGPSLYRASLDPFEANEVKLPETLSTRADDIICIDYMKEGDKEYLAIGTNGKRGYIIELPDKVLEEVVFKKAPVQCALRNNIGGIAGPSALFSERWGGVVWTGSKLNRTPSIRGLYRENKGKEGEDDEKVPDLSLSAHVSAPVWMDCTKNGLVTMGYSDGVMKIFDLNSPFNILEMKTVSGVLRCFSSKTGSEKNPSLSYITSDDVSDQSCLATFRIEDSGNITVFAIVDDVMKEGVLSAGSVKWGRESMNVPEALKETKSIKMLQICGAYNYVFTEDELYKVSFADKKVEQVDGYNKWMSELSKKEQEEEKNKK